MRFGAARRSPLYGFNRVYAIAVRFVTTPLLADCIAGQDVFVIRLIVLTVQPVMLRPCRSGALSPINDSLGLIFGLGRRGI